MNNTNYKNLCYSKENMSGLPYSDARQIEYAQSTSINAIRLNNTFKQLVDNDKAVEVSLVQLSSQASGPKSISTDDSSSKTELYNAENGFKFWQNGASNELSIAHKVDCDLQQSLFKTGLDGNVYDFCQAAGVTFAATDHGIYTIDADGKAKLFTEYNDIDDSVVQYDEIVCKGIFQDSYRTLFATDVGVYELNSTTVKEDTQNGTYFSTKLSLCKRNKTPLVGSKSVFIRQDNNMMFVGTDKGIYFGKYNPSTEQANIELEYADFVGQDASEHLSANKFALISPSKNIIQQSNDTLALTNCGIFQSHFLAQSVTGKDISLRSHDTEFAFSFEDQTYVGSKNGLFDAETDQLVFNYPAYSYAIANGCLYVGSDNSVLKVKSLTIRSDQPISVKQIFLPNEDPVVKMQSIGKYIARAVGEHELLLCFTQSGKSYTVDVATDTISFCKHIPVGNGSASNKRLVLANGIAQLSVISIADPSGDTSSDTISDSLDAIQKYDGLVDVTDDGQIVAQKTKLINIKTRKTLQAKDVTQIVSLSPAANENEYAYLDEGNVVLLNSEMTAVKSQISSYSLADTTHMLIGNDDIGMFTIDKDTFPNGDKSYLDAAVMPDRCHIAASGRYAYLQNGTSLSVFAEAYLLDSNADLKNAIKTCTAGLSNMSLVAYDDKLVINVLSTDPTEQDPEDPDAQPADFDESITLTKTFPMTLNDAQFDGITVKAATPTGLSTLYLSVDLSSKDNPIQIVNADYDISGKSVMSYHKIVVPNPYELIASATDVSAIHNEYRNIADADIIHGIHIADSVIVDDGQDHSLYALWNDTSLSIFDKETRTLEVHAGQINDVAFSLSGESKKAKVGKLYIASQDGLSSYDAKFTLSNDISAFDSFQLVSQEEFKSIKCIALSDQQVGTYFATDSSICAVSNGSIVELTSGFNGIKNFTGFAATGLCALAFTVDEADVNVLNIYNLKDSHIKTFPEITNVLQLAVIGDEPYDALSSDLSLIWTTYKDDYIWTASVKELIENDVQPSKVDTEDNVILSIVTDFRLNNFAYEEDGKTKLATRRHSKTYIQTVSTEDDVETYRIFEYSPSFDSPVLLTSSQPIAYCNFRDENQIAQYATRQELLSYGTATKVISTQRCYDIQSLVDNDQISVFFRSGNDVLSAIFKSTANLADIEVGAVPMLHNISAYTASDGNVSYVSADCYFDSISNKDQPIKLIDNSSSSKLTAKRMFLIDQIQSAALSIDQGTIIMIGEDGTAHTAQKDSTQLDAIPNATQLSVDELLQTKDSIYIRTGAMLSSADGTRFSLEADLSSDSIFQTTVVNAEDKKIFFYEDTYGWKYTFDGSTYSFIPQQLTSLNDYDVKRIVYSKIMHMQSNAILAIVPDGIYAMKFISQLKLSETANANIKSLPYTASAIYGKEDGEGSDSFVVVLSSEAGLSAISYNAKSNILSMTPAADYEGKQTFDIIGAFEGKLDSCMFYALSNDQLFISEKSSPTALQKYNDERILHQNASIRSAIHLNGKNYICTDKGVFVSKQNGSSFEFSYVFGKGTYFSTSIQQNSLTSLLAGDDGIYTIVNRGNELSTSSYKNSLCTDYTTALAQWDFTGYSPRYAYAVSNDILTSDNGKEFKQFMSLPNDVSVTYCIRPVNVHDFFFGTDNGAYMTDYKYVLSNDLKKFTASDARHAYDDIKDDLSLALSSAMQSHYDIDHAESSLVTYVNSNFLPADMSDLKLSSWGHVSFNGASSEMKVTDDLVNTIEFGDETTGDVMVTLSNFLTAETNAKCSYIMKRYMSGITELFIQVPTTNTYYINHVNGLPGCTKQQVAIDRQNLAKFRIQPFVADIAKHYSTFEIGIAAASLSIDTLLGVEACGNSLPLKCYRDKKFPDDDPNTSIMWHSYIEPTEIITTPSDMQPNENGEYKFKFACFGSDAQAVKITAFDPINNADAVHFTVKFNANGAQGNMTAQKFIAGIPFKLRACNFKWPKTANKTFAGWTDIPNPRRDTEVKYTDMQMFMKDKADVANGSVIELYAIWIDYSFDISDNIFSIANTTDQLFFNSANVLSSQTLENTVLIDYGK